MTVLDSYAATVRARAAIGKPDGAGMCLANVYKWFGSVQSIGPGAGQYDVALKGWNFATRRHEGDYDAPAGVPVYFGVSPTRTDKNKYAGDVGLSLGGGYAIFTDSPTGNPGVMSIRARAAQIQRPYLGWTEDFLGHDTQAGNLWRDQHKPIVTVAIKTPTTPAQPEKRKNTMDMVTASFGDTKHPLWNGIEVFDGMRSAIHTKTASEVYDLGRTSGLLRPQDNTEAKARQRLRDLGLEVSAAQVETRVRKIYEAGGYVDPYFKQRLGLK